MINTLTEAEVLAVVKKFERIALAVDHLNVVAGDLWELSRALQEEGNPMWGEFSKIIGRIEDRHQDQTSDKNVVTKLGIRGSKCAGPRTICTLMNSGCSSLAM